MTINLSSHRNNQNCRILELGETLKFTEESSLQILYFVSQTLNQG